MINTIYIVLIVHILHHWLQLFGIELDCYSWETRMDLVLIVSCPVFPTGQAPNALVGSLEVSMPTQLWKSNPVKCLLFLRSELESLTIILFLSTWLHFSMQKICNGAIHHVMAFISLDCMGRAMIKTFHFQQQCCTSHGIWCQRFY